MSEPDQFYILCEFVNEDVYEDQNDDEDNDVTTPVEVAHSSWLKKPKKSKAICELIRHKTEVVMKWPANHNVHSKEVMAKYTDIEWTEAIGVILAQSNDWKTITEAREAYLKYGKAFPSKEDRKTLLQRTTGSGPAASGMGGKNKQSTQKTNTFRGSALISAAKRKQVQTGMSDPAAASPPEKQQKVELRKSNPSSSPVFLPENDWVIKSAHFLERYETQVEKNAILMEENRLLKEEIALLKHTQELIKELPRLLSEVKGLTEKVKSARRGESHRSRGSTAPLSSKENIIVATPVLSTTRDHNTLRSTNLFKDEKVVSPIRVKSITGAEVPETRPDAVERKAARKLFARENEQACETEKENHIVTAQIQDEAAGGKIKLEVPMPIIEGDTNSGETKEPRLSDFIGKDGQILDESLLLKDFDTQIISFDPLASLNISATDFQVIEEKVVPLENGKTTTILQLVDQNKASGSCAGTVEKSQTMGEAFDLQPQEENSAKNSEDKFKQLISKPILTMRPAPVYGEQDIFKFGSKTLTGRELHGCKHNGSIRVLAADVFRLLFTDEEMALGSLSGKAPNAHKNFVPKSTLDAARIDGIVDYIAVFLTNSIERKILEKEVKRGITQKLNNFNKSSAAKNIHEKHLQKLKDNSLAAPVVPNAAIA